MSIKIRSKIFFLIANFRNIHVLSNILAFYQGSNLARIKFNNFLSNGIFRIFSVFRIATNIYYNYGYTVIYLMFICLIIYTNKQCILFFKLFYR